MNDFQKMGGIAALIEAAAYVVGFGLYFILLDSSGYVGPVQKVAFLVDNQAIMHIGNLIIYVVFSVFLVVLALALYQRLKTGSPALVQTATAFGLIWAGLVIASGMIFNTAWDRLGGERGTTTGTVILRESRSTEVPSGKLTFAAYGRSELDVVIEDTALELQQFESFYGFAIHSYESYRPWLEGPR